MVHCATKLCQSRSVRHFIWNHSYPHLEYSTSQIWCPWRLNRMTYLVCQLLYRSDKVTSVLHMQLGITSHYSWHCQADQKCPFIGTNRGAGGAASVITATSTGLVIRSQSTNDLSSMSWCKNSHLESQEGNLSCPHMDRPSTMNISLSPECTTGESDWLCELILYVLLPTAVNVEEKWMSVSCFQDLHCTFSMGKMRMSTVECFNEKFTPVINSLENVN